MLKKISIFILLINLSLPLSSCYTNSNDINTKAIDKKTLEKDNHEKQYTNSEETINKVQELINKQLKLINENNMNAYIETLDKSENEYIAEKKAWFRDITNNKVDDFTIKVLETRKTQENNIVAKINQRYRYNGKEYDITYENKYIIDSKKILDSDLNFQSLKTEHFIIKYPESEKNIAKIVSQGSESGYFDIINRLGMEPENKTVIKIYNDLELLRQSVKLTFAWQFGGWYEYPESIKIGISEFDKKLSDDQYNKKVERVVSHELTHKITLTRARNNLPYWLAEGLATHYTDYYDWTPNNFRRFSSLWSIDDLESRNLEIMTDNNDISKYYRSAGAITTYISYEFGKDKLLEIIEELGHYSYVEGTGVEVDSISIDRFHEVIEKVLGMSIEELDNYWINYKENL
ncbi:hypothetical protein [Sporosalibacterium faouarense]|uniref:hypothetical protein n=1 Tax=Sporosalibacterium faouarense TaxID=516123 RepID=UPI00192AFAA7|nr:hypothetical protein [Sporosalibacterium faouarense]